MPTCLPRLVARRGIHQSTVRECWKGLYLKIKLQEAQVCLLSSIGSHRACITRSSADSTEIVAPALLRAALTDPRVPGATEHNRKHSLPPTTEPSAKRSKKGKKAKTGSKAAIPELNPSDYVRVVKVTNRDDLLHEGPVLLSKSDKANQMTLSDNRMTVTSSKGYRMVCLMTVPITVCCKQQEQLNHSSLHW